MRAFGGDYYPWERKQWVLYSGRLVWKRHLAEMRAAAERRGLDLTYEVSHRIFSVKLTIAVEGRSDTVAQFDKDMNAILSRHAPLAPGG